MKAQGYPRRRPLPLYQARAGAAVDNPYSARAVGGWLAGPVWCGYLARVERRGEAFGELLCGGFEAGSGVRRDGPLMWMVMQWCCRRSSNASTSGLFSNSSYQDSGIEIRRDDGRHAPVALIHQAEEGVGLFGLEGQIPDFVNDKWLQARELSEQFGRRAIGERSVELVEQFLGVVEAARVAVEAGLAQQADRDSGLAGAGLTDQNDVLVAAQEVQSGQGADLGAVDAGLAIEGEGVEGPVPRQFRLGQAIGQALLAPVGFFLGEQAAESLRPG